MNSGLNPKLCLSSDKIVLQGLAVTDVDCMLVLRNQNTRHE